MANTVHKIFVDKMGGRNVSEFIGSSGDAFFDPDTGQIRVSDGSTVGGKPALPKARHQNVLTAYGDSRAAQISATGTFNDLSRMAAKNHRNWGNALAGNRAILTGAFATSGHRSDQTLAYLQAALATNCGVLDIQLGANDFGAAFGGYTCVAGGSGIFASPWAGTSITLSNVARVCYDNIMVAVNAALSFGVKVIVTLEAGSSNMTAGAGSQIGALMELNQRLREMAEVTPNVYLFDLPRLLWNLTGSTSAIQFVTGYMTGGEGAFTHEDPKGAYAAAADASYGYAALLKELMPPLPRNVRSILENSTNNPINLIPNPLFSVTTGGSLGAGATGTVPSGWLVARTGGSGTQSVVVSSGTPADGSPGNELILNCTFAAAGDVINAYQVAGSGLTNTWVAGDIYDMSCQVVSDGSSVLAGAFPFLQFTADTGSFYGSMLEAASGAGGWAAGPTGAYTIDLRTPKVTIGTYGARQFSQAYLRVVGSAAGTAQVRFRAPEVKKRFS